MKIKYLGTAAAEGIPALFCECDVCKKARELKGKNIRSRSQVLVNDDLLIDYPPDAFYHFINNEIDFSKIRNLIISHNHEDHFYPMDFYYFLKGFSIPNKCLPFTIHGSIDLETSVKPIIESDRNQGLLYSMMEPYKKYKVGNYLVTPLEANHGTAHPFIYAINDGQKSLLYCHDTGMLKDEVYAFLKNNKFYFDLVSLDCNSGDIPFQWSSHMDIMKNVETITEFKQFGIVDDNSKIVISHFSHNGGHVLYDEMCEIAKKYGFIVSYDGLEIKI